MWSAGFLKLTIRYLQPGAKALKGEEEEFIQSHHLFPADANNARTVTCRGTLIHVYHPDTNTTAWEWDDTRNNTTETVPPGYVVQVVAAWIKFGASSA